MISDIKTAFIQFLPEKNEKVVPFIKLTKSKIGNTGTATFFFKKPKTLEMYYKNLEESKYDIILNGTTLIWDEKKKKIFSEIVKPVFQNGEPYMIKSTFLFKNSKEWFLFLNFMYTYSKENELFFRKK
jgi:photosystem II protein